MRVENNVVILEREDCHWCKHRNTPQGTVPAAKWKTCDKCKGTGKRGNGRCRNCNDKNGYFGTHGRNPGHVIWYDDNEPVTCPNCNGKYKDFGEEDWCDNVPGSVFENMPIIVMDRPDRQMDWAEQHLGKGIWSSVDYGAYRHKTEQELIEEIRGKLIQSSTQAIKIVKDKESLVLCDGVAIVTGDMGYSLIPYWDER